MKTRVQDILPDDWLAHIGQGPIGLGLDLATTDKGTSNPSSLTVSESAGRMVHTRLKVRWKTADERVTTAVAQRVLDQLKSIKRKPRALSVDSSNERFYARQLRRQLQKFCPVRLIVSGEKVAWRGEELTYKELLGNLYSGLFEDALITLPKGEWILDDHRLVQRDRGTFVTATGKNGEHGDTFDSGKLAYWSLVKTGRAEASAVSISGSSSNVLARVQNWLARKKGVNVAPLGSHAAKRGPLRSKTFHA